MSSWKDEWKTIYQSDTEWLRIRKDGTEPTLEVAVEVGAYENDEGFSEKKVSGPPI
jgi:phosphomannomutase